MKLGSSDQPNVPSDALVELIRGRRGQLSQRQRTGGVHSLVARLAVDRSSWRLSLRAAVAGAVLVAVVCVGGATALLGRRSGASLSYAVEEGRVAPSGFIQADAASRPRIHFSDGTEVSLSAGTKAALRSVGRRGARVSLTDGVAHVDVVHLPGASWMFDAGPFLIAVTGTAFTMGWSAADELLDIHMERGSVEVSSPLSDEAMALRAGQRLIVRVRQRETVIRDDEPASPPVEAATANVSPPAEAEHSAAFAAPAPQATGSGPDLPLGTVPPAPLADLSGAPAPPTPTRLASSSAGRATPRGASRDWSARVAAGDFEAIVQQAARIGIDACLAQSNSADLAALADAARYGRHDEIARRALAAQRRRFPQAAAGRDASFLLGRLEEAEHDLPRALEWYDRYLADAGGGTYASEALGRKMNIVQRQSGDESARAVAEQYLGRFPQGTYATRARVLARAP
jgi:TolA-binding protein